MRLIEKIPNSITSGGSMSLSVAGKINSHNEWDKLREIIVGTAEGSMAVLTWSRPDPIPENVKEQAYDIAIKAFPK